MLGGRWHREQSKRALYVSRTRQGQTYTESVHTRAERDTPSQHAQTPTTALNSGAESSEAKRVNVRVHMRACVQRVCSVCTPHTNTPTPPHQHTTTPPHHHITTPPHHHTTHKHHSTPRHTTPHHTTPRHATPHHNTTQHNTKGSNRFCQPQRLLCTSHFLSRFIFFWSPSWHRNLRKTRARARARLRFSVLEEFCPQQSFLDLRASAPPMTYLTWRQYPRIWGQWNNWQQQKSSRGVQSYHSLQAQVKELKTLVAELKQSPVQESSRSSSSWPYNLAQLKKMKASCADEQTKQWLDTRISELQLQLSRGKSTAQQIESAKEEEKKTQDSMERMSRHVSEVCEKIEAAKAHRAPVRETISLLPLASQTFLFPVPPEQLLRQVWDSADGVVRSSDLFSAIRRVVFPDLTPSRSSFPVQMVLETPQCKRPPPSDHEISDIEQLDTETDAEQLETLMHIQGENSQLVPFRKKGAKETKELIVLSSLIPDCRLTAGALFREASLHDPRSLPSFAQVAAHRGTPADLWEAFCSLPKAHDHHLGPSRSCDHGWEC